LKGLIFIPGLAAFDASRDVRNSKTNIRLYVKRIFIGDSFSEDLVPNWLSYIKGVVDSADLPLNVSRELLQESRVVRTIRKQIVTRSLSMIASLQEDKDKWKNFWDSFGKDLKMGIVEDHANRLELARICSFHTSYQPNTSESITNEIQSMTTLDAYVNRMKEGQMAIYFFATNNIKTATNVPFVEKLVKMGYEVLFMTDPLDEYVAMNLAKFSRADDTKEYALLDVTRENVDIGPSDSMETQEKLLEEFEDLCCFIKATLKDKVDRVTISNRLESSPCVLVTSKFGWSANMERIMKAQAGADSRAYEYMRGKRTMEINTESRMILALLEEVRKDKESEKARDVVNFMFQTSLLTSGFDPEEPQVFAQTVYSLMERSMNY
jgi:heat shock protein beta